MYTGEFSMDTRVIEGKVPQAILGGRGICSLWPCMEAVSANIVPVYYSVRHNVSGCIIYCP